MPMTAIAAPDSGPPVCPICSRRGRLAGYTPAGRLWVCGRC